MKEPSSGTLQRGELVEQVSVKQSLSLFVNCEKTNPPIDSVETCEKGDQLWLGWVCWMLKHTGGVVLLCFIYIFSFGYAGSLQCAGFLVAVCGLSFGMWDLNSLTRERTWAPGIVNMESSPLDHQGSRCCFLTFDIFLCS